MIENDKDAQSPSRSDIMSIHASPEVLIHCMTFKMVKPGNEATIVRSDSCLPDLEELNISKGDSTSGGVDVST